VVTGATTTSAISPIPEMLRVGAVGIDGSLGDTYADGGVDVVAPGVDITSMGISGTGTFYGSGTQYAVAYVAGQAADVRSADPSATAAEVAQRIKSTAVAVGGRPRPDPSYGWGMINMAGSVQPPPPVTATPAGQSKPAGSVVSPTAVWITVILGAMLVLLLVWRVRRAVRTGLEPGSDALGDGGDDYDHPDPPGGPEEPRSARPAWAMSHRIPLPWRPRSGLGKTDAGSHGDAELGSVRATVHTPTAARVEPTPGTQRAELGSRSSYGGSGGRT
jgi:hypothetical protein